MQSLEPQQLRCGLVARVQQYDRLVARTEEFSGCEYAADFEQVQDEIRFSSGTSEHGSREHGWRVPSNTTATKPHL